MATIRFGTSGWRALLAEEFTFNNVRIICQAIATHLLEEGVAARGVIVGYDARFLGERFARAAAEVLTGNGIPTLLVRRETPTPAMAFHVLHRQLAGGITITASHNPPEYNGIKFTPAWGGPALPETTQVIEQRVTELLGGGTVKAPEFPGGGTGKGMLWEQEEEEGLTRLFDPCPEYLNALAQHVDLKAIGGADLRIVVDPLYGATRGYLDELLQRAGALVTVIHNWRDPYFGGRRPDPAGEALQDLQEAVVRERAHLGLATDGDGDRFGIVDSDGTSIEANLILGLVLDYLVETRRWTGGVARSVATTHLIDAIAEAHGLSVLETPIGFKFIGELLAKGEAVLGGEESAGLSIRGHVPDKDGILACMLVAEMVARRRASLQEMIGDLFRRVGAFYSQRQDLPVTETLRARLAATLAHPPATFAGSRVLQVIRLDGCKLLLEDGGWFLFRSSGTEPIVRCYGEAKSRARLEPLMAAGRDLVQEA